VSAYIRVEYRVYSSRKNLKNNLEHDVSILDSKTRICTDTHVHTHTLTHTHTHAHTRKHTHTHTRTRSLTISPRDTVSRRVCEYSREDKKRTGKKDQSGVTSLSLCLRLFVSVSLSLFFFLAHSLSLSCSFILFFIHFRTLSLSLSFTRTPRHTRTNTGFSESPYLKKKIEEAIHWESLFPGKIQESNYNPLIVAKDPRLAVLKGVSC